MSCQRNLTDYATVPGQRELDASAWDPAPDADPRRNRCECGNHIDPDTARVFGDAGDQARRCLGCATARQLIQGAGAGREDVAEARSQSPQRGGGRE